MTKLTDTQAILLAHGSQHPGGSLYPLPDVSLDGGVPAKRTSGAIERLIGRGLVQERETDDAAATCRVDGDLRYGLFVTALGLEAIGVADDADPEMPLAAAPDMAPAAKPPTKAALVLSLLGREQGATLSELIAATGWLPHTTRAALTGLRKKGHAIDRSKRDGAPCYRVAA